MGGYLFQQNYGFQVGDYLKKSMTYQSIGVQGVQTR